MDSAVPLFQVIRPVTLPLFLAAIFAVIGMPLQEEVTERCGGRGGVATLVITLAVLLLLVDPPTAIFVA